MDPPRRLSITGSMNPALVQAGVVCEWGVCAGGAAPPPGTRNGSFEGSRSISFPAVSSAPQTAPVT